MIFNTIRQKSSQQIIKPPSPNTIETGQKQKKIKRDFLI